MKYSFFKYMSLYNTLLCFILSLIFISCTKDAKDFDFNLIDSFQKAQPIWPKGKETNRNITVCFRQIVNVDKKEKYNLKITASTNYRVYINNKFLAHGPCVAAHDYYRIDSYDITDLLIIGKNIVAIEVCGYNEPSYYLLDQPSFLQAEIDKSGFVIAATGLHKDFPAYILNQRKVDVPRFSYQRPCSEYYILSSNYEDWRNLIEWDFPKEECLIVQQKKILPRGVPYPDYSIIKSSQLSDSIYMFNCNSTGFLGCSVKVKKTSKLIFYFDELLTGNDVNYKRLGTIGYIVYELEPGDYNLESFEPYTMKYVKVKIEGDCDILQLYLRNYVNADVYRSKFESNDVEINFLFETARETARQNTLDVFMDCPSRERAGWLCDSYFAARVAFDLSGYTWIEKNFFENFLLPESYKNIPKGMLPMCYPSDHVDKNFIPNWAMWFVLQLKEFKERSNNVQIIQNLKPKVYDLIDYFKNFKNEDGLLENLEKWVFVEWSAANSFVQDVNYPTNMLYAAMLDAASNLYNDSSLKNEANHIRQVIRKQSYNGEFFLDHAVRENGKLQIKNDCTEVCQYYAFYFKIATPDSFPQLWKTLINDFGPIREKINKYPNIHVANAFVGNYLRLELLSEYGYTQQLLTETIDEYMVMAKTTGTLWENMGSYASCNHGFASHILHVFYRDLLGVKSISLRTKDIFISFTKTELTHCKGIIPIESDFLQLSWEKKNDTLYYQINVPQDYRVKLENKSEYILKKIN